MRVSDQRGLYVIGIHCRVTILETQTQINSNVYHLIKDGQHVWELHLEHRAQSFLSLGHHELTIPPQAHSLLAPHASHHL